MPSFMQADAVQGYAPNKRGWIPLTDHSDSVCNTQHPEQNVAGGVEATTFIVEMIKDPSALALIGKCTTGATISKVVIEDCKADQAMTVLGRATLENVVVRKVEMASVKGGNRTAKFTLQYQKITWEERTPQGTYQEIKWSNVAA
jgi:type VI protein secretion system component Hcp